MSLVCRNQMLKDLRFSISTILFQLLHAHTARPDYAIFIKNLSKLFNQGGREHCTLNCAGTQSFINSMSQSLVKNLRYLIKS